VKSLKDRLLGFLDLLRIPATIQLSSWILIGTLLAFRDAGIFHLDLFLRVLFGAFLGVGGGLALNDWVDRKFDLKRLEKGYDEKSRFTKRRPLVEGIVSSEEAVLLTFFCILGAVLIASTAPFPRNFIIITFIAYFILAELLYQKTRHVLPVSFSITASIFGLWPLTGYIAVSDMFPTFLLLTLFVLAFFWEVCHNQDADIIDIENDKAVGLKTPSIVSGIKISSNIILFSSVIVFIASMALFMIGNLGPIYLIGAFLVGSFFLRSSYNVFKQPSHEKALNGFITAKIYVVTLFIVIFLDIMASMLVRDGGFL